MFRGDASDNAWDVHAHRGRETFQPGISAAQRRPRRHPARRCPEALGREEVYRLLADIGYNFGPKFQGVAHLWRGERETLADIRILTHRPARANIRVCYSSGRFSTHLPSFRTSRIKPASYWQDVKGIYVPVRIDRVLLLCPTYGPESSHLPALLKEISAAEVTADMQILDEAGNRLIDLENIVCRPTEHPAAESAGYFLRVSMEARFSVQRTAQSGTRITSYRRRPWIPSLRNTAEMLWQRFDRVRLSERMPTPVALDGGRLYRVRIARAGMATGR